MAPHNRPGTPRPDEEQQRRVPPRNPGQAERDDRSAVDPKRKRPEPRDPDDPRVEDDEMEGNDDGDWEDARDPTHTGPGRPRH